MATRHERGHLGWFAAKHVDAAVHNARFDLAHRCSAVRWPQAAGGGGCVGRNVEMGGKNALATGGSEAMVRARVFGVLVCACRFNCKQCARVCVCVSANARAIFNELANARANASQSVINEYAVKLQ